MIKLVKIFIWVFFEMEAIEIYLRNFKYFTFYIGKLLKFIKTLSVKNKKYFCIKINNYRVFYRELF